MTHTDRQKILLIGSGTLARDIVSVLGRDLFAGTYVDPGFPVTPVEELPVYTDWDEARRHVTHYALGILDRGHRQRAREAAGRAGLLPCTPLVHPSAQVAATAFLSPGCLVGYFSVIGPVAWLEEDILVMYSAVISHDTVIGSNSVILHGAYVGGYTRVGEGCFVGVNATLAPNISVGDNAFVAAGAACFRDVPPDCTLVGNPARITARPKN